MAIQIEWRNSIAATWTSTNPVLAQGEKGVETDTGQFKIGDGTTAWNSLTYKGQTGPTQTSPYRSFGDGSDGNITISSGTTTLTRDMFYNNLTMSGTGKLVTNNFKIFIKNNLDLTAAAIGAINNNGTVGTNGTNAGAGGTAPTVAASGTLGTVSQPGNGGAGSANNGTAGTGAGAITGNGGGTNGSAVGGVGGTGTGGAAGASAIPTVAIFNRWVTNFLRGIVLIGGGGSSGGGGGGGGDTTFVGGGGGSGGMAGGPLVIYANNIIKSANTVASTIQAIGGTGGTGGNGDPAGNTGGGGGGGGGAGGWISIYFNNIYGPIVKKMLDTSGGAGGTGGQGQGTGASARGGLGANAGTIQWFQVPNMTTSSFSNTAQNFFSATTWTPQVNSGAVINNVPSAGGLGQPYSIDF